MTKEKKKILLFGALGIGALLLFTHKSAADLPADTGEIPDVSPSIDVPVYAAPLVSYLAIQNRSQLIKYAAGNQLLINAYNKMNDAEINASWEYVWSYLLRGLKLYQYPNASGIYPDGGWNTTLYNQIAAIRSKYGIF